MAAKKIDAVTALRARAEARALLWSECELELQEAVDKLQVDAARDGLDPDPAQKIIADAFELKRTRLNVWVIIRDQVKA